MAIVEDCNRLMLYVDKSDCVKGSCTISKQLFFHLLDLPILNIAIILMSFGSELSHQLFKLIGEGAQGKAN